MFCHIIFWVVANELINFDMKYPYMYRFGRLCSTWIWSLSKVLSMIGMEIMPHALPSVSRILLSPLSLK